jgi:uncharacterized membrane protein YccC
MNPMIGRFRAAFFDFDRPRLAFALRTAFVACFAMACAWALGLDHPQWSAMTVWAASQPTRGRLIEKALFRLAGTLSGATVGVVLVLISGLNPWILLPGLALWIALCAGIGNLQRGFVSYSTILAGYSAAMVILLDYGHSDTILSLADDRVLTILTGVASAVIWGAILTPQTAEGHLDGRLRRLTTDLLEAIAGRLAGHDRPTLEAASALTEIAAIEDMLDPHSGGFFRSRTHVRHCRRLLNEAVALLLWLEEGGHVGFSKSDHAQDAAKALLDAAELLKGDALTKVRVAEVNRLLRCAIDLQPASILADGLGGLHQALDGLVRRGDYAAVWPLEWRRRGGEWADAYRPISLHRDWFGALRAGLRAFVVLLSVGLFWHLTGWTAGPYLMLGSAIMISLFSTFDSPSLMMRYVLSGSALGALLAVLWRLVVWPYADSLVMAMILVMPVILIGALFMAHRKTVRMAMDVCMVSLLCLQPVFPLPEVNATLLQMIGAVVIAPLIALIAYGVVLPTTPRLRRQALRQAIFDELALLARIHHVKPMVWRARLYHRLIKLHRWSEHAPGAGRERSRHWAAEALAMTALGQIVLRLRDALEKSAMPEASQRRLVLVLRRIQRLSKNQSERSFSALERALRAAAKDRQGHDADLAVLLERAAYQVSHVVEPKEERGSVA